MKSPEKIDKKLEKGYLKHCETTVAELIAETKNTLAIIDGLYNKVFELEDRIDDFDFDDPQLRSQYYGNDISRNTGSMAVSDYVK